MLGHEIVSILESGLFRPFPEVRMGDNDAMASSVLIRVPTRATNDACHHLRRRWEVITRIELAATLLGHSEDRLLVGDAHEAPVERLDDLGGFSHGSKTRPVFD